ncbi:hypothetical protein [Actinomycetospora termitidis]|uniref:Uncharacterized protein n=1 Tax=Actinomycetospora termitidis TaxID=3053470 RepID=A0ABT7MG16_9PSEU|nr:hypothetical protein [Actinomycetospora sp. Odt1-22]MDL5159623.1 hypothetical protein [Actinomycetospora sp. Odt1-22]
MSQNSTSDSLPAGQAESMGGNRGPRAQLPASDKRFDVAIAEFNALRAEMVSISTAQATLVGVGLTAIGVIYGFLLGDDPDRRIGYAIPALSLILSSLYSNEGYKVTKMGTYIRRELWPYLQRELDPKLPAWETFISEARVNPRELAVAVVLNSSFYLLLVGAAIVALSMAWGPNTWVNWLSIGAIALTVAIPTTVSVLIVRLSRKAEAS